MVFQWWKSLSWIFLADYVAGFEIDGIYPISGGVGEVTIYGSNLNDLNDLRFRSETIQGLLYSYSDRPNRRPISALQRVEALKIFSK